MSIGCPGHSNGSGFDLFGSLETFSGFYDLKMFSILWSIFGNHTWILLSDFIHEILGWFWCNSFKNLFLSCSGTRSQLWVSMV